MFLALLLIACTADDGKPTPPGPQRDSDSGSGSSDDETGDAYTSDSDDSESTGGDSADSDSDTTDSSDSADTSDSTDTSVSTPDPIAVYILTGQSNSLGTTQFEGINPALYGPGSHDADGVTMFFWSNVDAGNTAYPPVLYGDSGGGLLSLQVQQGGGADPSFWGPEFGLARRLYEAGDGEVLIIKASRGGGGNTWWDKASFEVEPDNGHMWGHLADTTELALGAALELGRGVEVRGLLYLQGESNSDSEAALADVRLADLVANLTAHIEGVVPGAAADMHTVIGEIAASGSTSARVSTTELQEALAESSPDISFVGTSDLPLKEDGIHFGKAAKLAIGERFADVLIAAED